MVDCGMIPRKPAEVPPSPAARSRPVSIEDVAGRAGVSTATVSRVLNNPELVAPATAERVQKAIADLDYRPNLFAKGLMTRKSHVLGVALPDIYGEFYSELLRGADGEARKLGYHLLVSSETRLNGREQDQGTLAFGLVDGLALMITEPNDALLREALKLDLPLVVLDSDIKGGKLDSVVVDNDAGTREAVSHLLSTTPAQRCVFVGGPKENFDTQGRAEAFLKQLVAAGVTPTPDQTVYGEYSMEWGEKWAEQRAKAGTLKGLGVLCGNDEIAYGVMRVAQDSDLSIPKDLRLIGFDDSRLSRLVRPRLSSVRMPAAEVGAAAIQALVMRVNEPTRAPRQTTLATNLIIRESSR